jgi:hypothetical protein
MYNYDKYAAVEMRSFQMVQRWKTWSAMSQGHLIVSVNGITEDVEAGRVAMSRSMEFGKSKHFFGEYLK